MDSKITYREAQPENQKDTYQEYDQVDFKLDIGAGNKLVCNSLRLVGSVSFGEDNVVLLDNHVGGHAFVNQIITTTQNQGIIENIENYGRYVGMSSKASYNKNDMMNSNFVCELKSPDPKISGSMVKAQTVGVESELADFSCKLQFCLNSVEGNVLLDPSQCGQIMVTLRLQRSDETLYGLDFSNDNNANMVLSDLRLTYLTVMDDSKPQPVLMRKKICLQNQLDSSYNTISTKVPGVCRSVSCSLMYTQDEGSKLHNSYRQDKIPNLRSLQFLFNDSQDSRIAYEIRDQMEVVENYLRSFGPVDKNESSLVNMSASLDYGVGLDFGLPVDLSQQKFSIIFDSDVSNVSPLSLYMYFHSELEL